MKAIIPVAGQGTRIMPHTAQLQKCLLPVAGKPILQHILEPLIDINVDEIVLIIGHLGEQVRSFTERYPKIKFTFIEQQNRLGLGHAVLQGVDESPEPVMVVLGDTIIQMDYQGFVTTQENVIGVVEVPDPERFGIVEVEGNDIINFMEKPQDPPTNLAISGIYYFASQNVLHRALTHLIENDIRSNNEYQLTDALQKMLESGEKFVWQKIDKWLDCGLIETLLATNKTLFDAPEANYVAADASVSNSRLRTSHISQGCAVVDSTLNNVILLRNSRVENSSLSNQIVGIGKVIRDVN